MKSDPIRILLMCIVVVACVVAYFGLCITMLNYIPDEDIAIVAIALLTGGIAGFLLWVITND